MPVEASVTVIVLNWNGKVLLEDCLSTLEKVEYNNYNVLVVDNGSTDGTSGDWHFIFGIRSA